MKFFFNELKRRNVYKVALTYAIVAWLIVQIGSVVFETINAPQWVMQVLLFFVIIGFPIALILAWAFEMSPKGMIRTSSLAAKENSYSSKKKKPLTGNIFIGALALIIIGQFAYNRFANKEAVNIINVDKSIAVLPFDDLSSEGDTEWFCDGVTEDILTYLSKMGGLTVISRTSTEQYKLTDKTIPEIAQELGVSFVVEGSVRKQGNRVLITAQLINKHDRNIWTGKYNEPLDDVFEIQQDVSRRIVQQLKIKINPSEEKALTSSGTNNIEAYQIFLKGRSIADTRTKEDLEKSIDLYQRAIDLDPNYAEAYAEMANSYFLMVDRRFLNFDEVKFKMNDLIKRALEIDPNTVRAYTVGGNLYVMEREWKNAKKNFEKAIMLNPNDATAHHHFAVYYNKLPVSDGKNSLYEINLAANLDPFSSPINSIKQRVLIQNNKFKEAEEHFYKTSFLYSPFVKLYYESQIKGYLGKDWTEVIGFLEKEIEKNPNNEDLLKLLSIYYNDVFGDKKRALKYAKLAHEVDSSDYDFPVTLIFALMNCNNWTEAKILLNGDHIDKETKNFFVMIELYLKDQPQKALSIYYTLNQIDPDWELLFLSEMGEREKISLLRMEQEIPTYIMAQVYANLKERDSMYYYLDKTSDVSVAMDHNFDKEFDPYRKEERYKEYLRKNYLPITHWNE